MSYWINRGPGSYDECPHCNSVLCTWIWRHGPGKASEYNPQRLCPLCKEEA